jgi:hypothetical protein
LKWYDGGGENGITPKGFLRLKCFSPLKILISPLKRLLELFFLPLFLFLSFFFFQFFFLSAPSLENIGVLMIFEEKITSSKTSFQAA